MCQNGAQLCMDTTHTLIHCIISKIGEDQRYGPICCFPRTFLFFLYSDPFWQPQAP